MTDTQRTLSQGQSIGKFGPIGTEVGVSGWNMWTLMYASLVAPPSALWRFGKKLH
jgi:hypothetical protein